MSATLPHGTVCADPVRAGDVFRFDARRVAVVTESLPGGKAVLRIEGERAGRPSVSVAEYPVREIKSWPRLGRATFSDGTYERYLQPAAEPLPELLSRAMKIDAIFWQPNERLLTVQTADKGYQQVGKALSDDDLVASLGEELADAIRKPERHAPELSERILHVLRREGLGYLHTDYSSDGDPVTRVIRNLDEADDRPSFRP